MAFTAVLSASRPHCIACSLLRPRVSHRSFEYSDCLAAWMLALRSMRMRRPLRMADSRRLSIRPLPTNWRCTVRAMARVFHSSPVVKPSSSSSRIPGIRLTMSEVSPVNAGTGASGSPTWPATPRAPCSPSMVRSTSSSGTYSCIPVRAAPWPDCWSRITCSAVRSFGSPDFWSIPRTQWRSFIRLYTALK